MHFFEACPVDMGHSPQRGGQGDSEQNPPRSPFTAPPDTARNRSAIPSPIRARTDGAAGTGSVTDTGNTGKTTPESISGERQHCDACARELSWESVTPTTTARRGVPARGRGTRPGTAGNCTMSGGGGSRGNTIRRPRDWNGGGEKVHGGSSARGDDAGYGKPRRPSRVRIAKPGPRARVGGAGAELCTANPRANGEGGA